MSAVEIDLEALGDDFTPGLRAEVGQEEVRSDLDEAREHELATTLHFGPNDEMYGRVADVGAGVIVFDRFGADENAHTVIPLDKIVWFEVKRRV
jgi:hypothetical protein